MAGALGSGEGEGFSGVVVRLRPRKLETPETTSAACARERRPPGRPAGRDAAAPAGRTPAGGGEAEGEGGWGGGAGCRWRECGGRGEKDGLPVMCGGGVEGGARVGWWGTGGAFGRSAGGGADVATMRVAACVWCRPHARAFGCQVLLHASVQLRARRHACMLGG